MTSHGNMQLQHKLSMFLKYILSDITRGKIKIS